MPICTSPPLQLTPTGGLLMHNRPHCDRPALTAPRNPLDNRPRWSTIEASNRPSWLDSDTIEFTDAERAELWRLNNKGNL